jgi:hypothetical protein
MQCESDVGVDVGVQCDMVDVGVQCENVVDELVDIVREREADDGIGCKRGEVRRWSHSEHRVLWEVYEESISDVKKGYGERMFNEWKRRGMREATKENLYVQLKVAKGKGLGRLEREDISRMVRERNESDVGSVDVDLVVSSVAEERCSGVRVTGMSVEVMREGVRRE